jgi:hypothetical protein
MDVIDYLIAVCVKADKNPLKPDFADFIIKKCSSKFGYDRYKARSFIDSLLNAWRDDRWKSYIENNPYLTNKEKEEWMKKHE